MAIGLKVTRGAAKEPLAHAVTFLSPDGEFQAAVGATRQVEHGIDQRRRSGGRKGDLLAGRGGHVLAWSLDGTSEFEVRPAKAEHECNEVCNFWVGKRQGRK